MSKKIISRLMSGVLATSMVMTAFVGCVRTKRDSIVLMAEEMSGLFNPFYATSGADMDVVGMTQIGMLSTDKNGNPVANDQEATVVKAFNFETVGEGDNQKTVYTFVLKNGIEFADGKPLTMNDVLFNMYVYLDPSYTGSSTMYSTDIVGLREYRLQRSVSDENAADEEVAGMNNVARTYAKTRLDLLFQFYKDLEFENDEVEKEDLIPKIEGWDFNPNEENEDGYVDAVLPSYEQVGKDNEYYRAQLKEDYQLLLDTFKDELEADYKAAKESYDLTVAPYKDWTNLFQNDVFKFFFYEGIIIPTYANNGKDKQTIIGFSNGYEDLLDRFNTMEKAIQHAYDHFTVEDIFSFATYNTLVTKYTAEAMDILLHEQLYAETGSATGLLYKNISGIKSLGHSTDETEVRLRNYCTKENGEVDNTVPMEYYKVAHEHNEDGTPKNADEYDVLQITVNGVDPKAVYNFGFTVAPAHYYGSANGTGNDVDIDISEDKFGVEWASSDFQSKVIQSPRNVEVPMGAGPFQATNLNNDTNPEGSEFWSSNIVYFKRHDGFLMGKPKAEKLRFQVVSAANAIGQLAAGDVDYITPQFTTVNSATLKNMEKDGFKTLSSWQLGYGYIGINAGKIDNVFVRRAIMTAMQVGLAKDYYDAGTCLSISWPMSKVSWAYPKANEQVTSDDKDNGKSWTRWEDLKLTSADAGKTTEEKFRQAISKIKDLMQQAENSGWDGGYEFTFTIAGASISEHPTYTVFRQAEEILDACGWDIDVQADSQALTKLATGSLEVWAAAWGSTVDPDMYQVYHFDSTATSTFAWGYREIKDGSAGNHNYPDGWVTVGDKLNELNPGMSITNEYELIKGLSLLIDAGRETLVKTERKEIYEEAMKLVLDLAVEMPVYQRMTLYAFNSKTVKGFSEVVNPHSSPLEKIWELELI